MSEEIALADWSDPGEKISFEVLRQRFAEVLPRQLATILKLAERGTLDKARIDALISIGRVFERTAALAEEEAREKQTRSDDELAAMLQRVNDRIIELARAYAEELVEAERRGVGG